MKISRMQCLSVVTASLSVCVLMPIGCSKSTDEAKSPLSAPVATVKHGTHPTEGPHHGTLIELGDEAYHAELVHDKDTGSVTIYLLDSAAEIGVPVTAAELNINLKHGGQSKQHSLAASPDVNDPTGKSSRFQSNNAGLAEALDLEDSHPQLVVNIDGKQYRGKIQHEHDE